jgi:hypothetical protein
MTSKTRQATRSGRTHLIRSRAELDGKGPNLRPADDLDAYIFTAKNRHQRPSLTLTGSAMLRRLRQATAGPRGCIGPATECGERSAEEKEPWQDGKGRANADVIGDAANYERCHQRGDAGRNGGDAVQSSTRVGRPLCWATARESRSQSTSSFW